MTLADPPWLGLAKSYLGLRETKGPHHNQKIVSWWEKLKLPFRDDETAWCGAFVGGVFKELGMPVVASPASAKGWLQMGNVLDKPAVGAVVIFWRGTPNGPFGHVGFVVGKDQHDNIMVLGGNQGDMVSIKPFSRARVKGYRWPGTAPKAERFNLPMIGSDGRVSTNEA